MDHFFHIFCNFYEHFHAITLYLFGYPDGIIEPKKEINRSESAAIFFRLFCDENGNNSRGNSGSYPDVNASSWYHAAISAITEVGVLTGYPDDSFRPGRSITRAEFMAIAARFVESGYNGKNLFPDIEDHWAAEYINLAAQLGWVKGYPDGRFRPEAYISRAEAVAVINRMLERAPEDKADLLPDMITWLDNSEAAAWYYLDIQEATNSHSYERKEDGYYERWTEL